MRKQKRFNRKGRRLYREHILNYCYDELQIRYRDKLELNIVEALRKEADYKNRDRDEYVREKLKTCSI